MSRFRKLSQTLWHCQYHIVWVPKYRFRILKEEFKEEVAECIKIFSEQQRCEIHPDPPSKKVKNLVDPVKTG